MPLSELNKMPERDLQEYARYAAEEMLPSKRRDYYMAQLTYWVASTMGGYQGQMTDFLLGADRTAAEAETDDTAEEDIDWDGTW